MTAQAYALVEYDGCIYCSEYYEGSWESVTLQGSFGARLSWPEALDELNDRIGSEKNMADMALHLLVDDQSLVTLLAISNKLESLSANKINLYPMRWMLDCFSNGEFPGSTSINQVLLNQVSNTGVSLVPPPLPVSSEQSDSSSELTELKAYCKQLQAESAEQKRQQGMLQNDNEKLRRRLANHTQVLSDGAVNSYLACIFNNYWGNVSLDDHCIYTGQINKPSLISPVREPTEVCIRQISSEIVRLSSDERLMLRELCRKLSKACGGLKVRNEFEFLLDDQALQVFGVF